VKKYIIKTKDKKIDNLKLHDAFHSQIQQSA